jgi:hypothetical protein
VTPGKARHSGGPGPPNEQAWADAGLGQLALQGLQGLQGLHGLAAAHGLQGPAAGAGLQGLHGFLITAAQGLHGLQGLDAAAHGLHGLQAAYAMPPPPRTTSALGIAAPTTKAVPPMARVMYVVESRRCR